MFNRVLAAVVYFNLIILAAATGGGGGGSTTTKTATSTVSVTSTVTSTAVVTSSVAVTVTVPVTTTVATTKTAPPTTTTVSTGGGSPSNQCNTGALQCCNSVQAANSPTASGLLGLLGIVVGSVTGLVGITCSPLSVLGIGNGGCSAQPVCCTNNSFNGIISLGCIPITL